MQIKKSIFSLGQFEITIGRNKNFLYGTIRKYNPSILHYNDYINNFIIRNAERSDIEKDVENGGGKLKSIILDVLSKTLSDKANLTIDEATFAVYSELINTPIKKVDISIALYSNRAKLPRKNKQQS